MIELLWSAFCGDSSRSCNGGKECSYHLMAFYDSSSCINHVIIVSVDVLLLFFLLFYYFHKQSLRRIQIRSHNQGFSTLQIISSIYNGGLGLLYFGLGVWILENKLKKENTTLPLHLWLMDLFHGFTWFLLTLTWSFGQGRREAYERFCSVLTCLVSGFLCISSLLVVVLHREISIKIILDALSLPGAILLVLCTFRVCKDAESDLSINTDSLYTPLNGETNASSSNGRVTPFARAGCLSTMSFGWLNPLMRKGNTKILESEDLPHLREEDLAGTCYRKFMEQLNRQKDPNQSTSPSIVRNIFLCHWRGVLVSGFFALLKIVNLSAGPLILKAFIELAEGKEAFRYEGYILAILLFLTKFVESLSQRQWYFRSRIIGLQVRSLLSAAIYNKQLRLSNAAKSMHSAGEIINYVTLDAYRIGELPYWFHQTWTTTLQLCITLGILYQAVGLATIATLIVIILTVLCNTPLAKLHQKSQAKLMEAQDERLKSTTEALVNMKVLKLYAWETHFKHVIDSLREKEYKCLSAVQLQKAYYSVLFWTSPVLVSAATFGTCYFLGIPLNASNVFTFVATLRLVQDPIRSIPDVIGVIIQARVALNRIMKFLEAPVLWKESVRRKCYTEDATSSIFIKSASFSWEGHLSKLILQNINLVVKPGEKVAICGEVGSGKSTLLAAILGEVPIISGTLQVYGTIAYVSQMAWIQSGTIQENILFGSTMDGEKYSEVVGKCSLEKDLQMLPFGDQTEIGERGINLSGGQKQRVQLARALYRDADIYLLDDPFSAVDAHTAKSLFNEFMGALSGKTVVLVTHQVDFLPPFDSVLFMSDGEILCAAPYDQLLASSNNFQDLVNAHKYTAGSEKLGPYVSPQRCMMSEEMTKKNYTENRLKASVGDQLIKQEEKERGDTGLKPYVQYLSQNKGFFYISLAGQSYLVFVIGQIIQNSWMAANVQKPSFSRLRLVIVYLLIGISSAFFLVLRSLFTVIMGLESSKSLYSQLMNSLFRAPMSFYDSTPLGRILSRVSSDLSIVDLDVPFSLMFTVSSTMNAYSSLGVLAVFTWPILFVALPMVFLTIHLQRYYFATAKELMRISGTTKSMVANHLAESVAGAMTIRAFEEEDRFFSNNLVHIDANASPFFHNFAANEWLIQRLELFGAVVLSTSSLALALLPPGTFGPGFIGMALSYGLSLNISLVISVQNQLTLASHSVSVERLNQYMHIDSEAPEIIEGNRSLLNWPATGKVEIYDLKIRYRPGTPFVLCGISCTFEGAHKIGIVGRTGSGKTTLISSLFRLVEPTEGRIMIDDVDISKIGLHDLRSHLAVIPQDPTLFRGSVRYNLDPLSQFTDKQIWEVVEDGSNWSMGQRQLFCLGRALLRRSRILVLDEATASVDNATDSILQKTIRTEFADCTVITVAHRIPTVMDCTMVLVMSDGKIAEYDEPMTLMKTEGSLFGQLVHEYWSTAHKE